MNITSENKERIITMHNAFELFCNADNSVDEGTRHKLFSEASKNFVHLLHDKDYVLYDTSHHDVPISNVLSPLEKEFLGIIKQLWLIHNSNVSFHLTGIFGLVNAKSISDDTLSGELKAIEKARELSARLVQIINSV
ncbi:MAG: hypothetical protein ACP5N1_04870 [Candidatus Woesearchaeota archaeon]